MRFLACIPILFLAAEAFAGTYYFSPTGNDANSGADWANAKSDLQAFVQTQTVANVIYLSAGEWQMTNSWLAIPKNQKIVGDNRNSVLRGTGTNGVISLVNQTNVWLEGLTITGGYNNNDATVSGQGGGIVGGSGAGPLYASQTVTNCLIVSNSARRGGGGVYFFGFAHSASGVRREHSTLDG